MEMNLVMLQHVVLPGESLIASFKRARIRFLARMDAHVPVKVALVPEMSPAVGMSASVFFLNWTMARSMARRLLLVYRVIACVW